MKRGRNTSYDTEKDPRHKIMKIWKKIREGRMKKNGMQQREKPEKQLVESSIKVNLIYEREFTNTPTGALGSIILSN